MFSYRSSLFYTIYNLINMHTNRNFYVENLQNIKLSWFYKKGIIGGTLENMNQERIVFKKQCI